MKLRLAIGLAIGASACGGKRPAAEIQATPAPPPDARAADATEVAQLGPPVRDEALVPCAQLIDLAAWQTALGEPDPLELADDTAVDPDAAAVCNLVKGGRRLTAKEQEALAKKTHFQLGVLPGDTICTVSAYCWTIETAESFAERCGDQPYASMNEAGMCRRVVPMGPDDVDSYRFFDADTRCILGVTGGPSNRDNDQIALCARTAATSIGPEQIAP